MRLLRWSPPLPPRGGACLIWALSQIWAQVLIVDEVDDLIVNERPNAHYVKKDVVKTPALVRCYEALKGTPKEDLAPEVDLPNKAARPDGVDDDTWFWCCEVVKFTEGTRVLNKHYRLVEDADGKRSVLQLDDSGNVPKVSSRRRGTLAASPPPSVGLTPPLCAPNRLCR